MRQMFIVLAATALMACETLPEFATAQPLGPAYNAPASDSPPQPSPFAPPPEQQLLELERQLSAAAQERGLGAALSDVIDPLEGIAIRSGVTYTAADITQGLAPPANAGPIYWQPDRVHVSNSGDMGVTSGRYVQVVTGSEAVQGRYVVVWRRQGGGEWQVLTETRVADPPRTVRRR